MIEIVEADLSSDSDRGFIYNSWIKSFRDACSGGVTRHPPLDLYQDLIRDERSREAFYSQIERFIRGNLKSKYNRTILAHLDSDRDVYVGWACGNENVLHYVYVKRSFKRLGFGKQLYKELGSPKTYSLRTWPWVADQADKYGMEHVPESIFGYE